MRISTLLKNFRIKLVFLLLVIIILIFYPSILLINFGLIYINVGKVEWVMQYDLVNIYSLVTDYIQSSKTFYDTANLGIPADTFFLKRYLYFLYMPLTIIQEFNFGQINVVLHISSI